MGEGGLNPSSPQEWWQTIPLGGGRIWMWFFSRKITNNTNWTTRLLTALFVLSFSWIALRVIVSKIHIPYCILHLHVSLSFLFFQKNEFLWKTKILWLIHVFFNKTYKTRIKHFMYYINTKILRLWLTSIIISRL